MLVLATLVMAIGAALQAAVGLGMALYHYSRSSTCD